MVLSGERDASYAPQVGDMATNAFASLSEAVVIAHGADDPGSGLIGLAVLGPAVAVGAIVAWRTMRKEDGATTGAIRVSSGQSHEPPSHDQPTESGDDHDHSHDDHDHTHDDHDHTHGTGIWARLKHLYRPHSHDSADSIDSALESSARGIRAVKISLAGLITTALLQLIIVVVSGSVALLADTIHNFSDALTSIPLWIAFVIGRRAATSTYTFGFRRAEDLSGLFIIAVIALSAFLAGWESVQRLIEPREVENLGLVAAAGIIGFFGNEIVAIYRIRIGRQIGSAALVADGQHARIDGLTSLAVVVGAIGVAAGFPGADPIIGLLITVAILFVLRDAARQVIRRLMDGVDPEMTAEVESIARQTPGVLDVSEVRLRWIGHRMNASLTIEVAETISLVEGHNVAEAVRDALFERFAKLDDVIVQVNPETMTANTGSPLNTNHRGDEGGRQLSPDSGDLGEAQSSSRQSVDLSPPEH